MNANELLAAAFEADPAAVEKTANALFVLERWESDFADELKNDISHITNHTMEKMAGADWGKFGLGVAGAALSGLGASVAGDLYDAAKRGLTKGKNFRAIMLNNPELQRSVDKKTLLNSFNTLHRYAPEFTADPMLGGQILKSMSEIPENQVTVIKDLLNARKTLREAKGKQFSFGSSKADLNSGKSEK